MQLLISLRHGLETRSGVVRLLHTSNAGKEMKFKTAGGFKQMFLSGGKLQQSGEVIRALLNNAGADELQMARFDTYLRLRGTSGVQTPRVREEIDLALRTSSQAAVWRDETEALANLGIQLQTGARIGEGGVGRCVNRASAASRMCTRLR
jgi:hypothetical protein